MGLISRLLGEAQTIVTPEAPQAIAPGANVDMQAYDSEIARIRRGPIWQYDIRRILLNKQLFIQQLFELANFYRDADPIVHGIIYHVYLPYILSSPWQLYGHQKTNAIYEAYYKKIRLDERLKNIACELVTYNNVFVYFLNGAPITLPISRCRIGNLQLNGRPLVEFDCQAVIDDYVSRGFDVYKGWVKDHDPEVFMNAFPPEVVDALNDCKPWVQLNPKYTFVLQGAKDGWSRYAVPFISAALLALEQKDIIRKWETAILNLGVHSFVHTQYGGTTKERDIIPDETALNTIHGLFRKAMNGFPLVTTSHLAKAYVVQPEMDDLFQWDKYKNVNNDILAAGGISGVLVTGVSSDGATFASAQVSMQTAEARIEAMRLLLCELMDKLNVCIKEELAKSHIYNVKEVPHFTFLPLEMSGRKALREKCEKLWAEGLLSTETLMHTEGYNLDHEVEQRKREAARGIDDILAPRVTNVQQTNDDSGSSGSDGGRPEMTDEERHSDPESSDRGAQPKPSTDGDS